LFEKQKNHVQPNTLGVCNIPTIAYCHFVVFCWHYDIFVFPHLLSSLVLFECVFVVDQA
jgi:hypothetical protein